MVWKQTSTAAIAFTVAVVSSACAAARAASSVDETCAPVSADRILINDSVQEAMLSGSFVLTTVNTSDPQTGPTVSHAPLFLRVADSAERAAARSLQLGNRPRAIRLVGQHRWTPDEHPPGYQPVEITRDGMNIGCQSCLDANPVGFAIREITAQGFRGDWSDPQMGIVRAVRPDGSLKPNPEGHFCAVRVANPG